MSFDINRVKTTSINRNDCAIIALSVYNDIPYDKAFDMLRNNYSRGGTNISQLIKHLADTGSKVVTVGTTKPAKWFSKQASGHEDGMTLESFCKKYPTGTYYVIVAKHALVVKNGVVYDNANTTKNKRVIMYAKKDS